MQSLGIDLSTDPRKVWACEIDWAVTPPAVTALDRMSDVVDPRSLSRAGEAVAVPRPVRDEAGLIAALVDRIERFGPAGGRVVGIDAPFGWPVAFVEAISDWEDGDLRGFSKRTELRLRATDRFVQAVTGLTPMSVSADRIGSTAMLCAEVLSTIAHRADAPRLDRARAAQGLAEVYPAAALRQWTNDDATPLTSGGYKVSFAAREALLRDLIGLNEPDDADEGLRFGATGQSAGRGASGVLVSPSDIDRMIEFDDALDAFVCALVARAIALGNSLSVDRPAEPTELWQPFAGSAGASVLPTTAAERLAARTDAAADLQSAGMQSAEAEGWIHVPARGRIRPSIGLAATAVAA